MDMIALDLTDDLNCVDGRQAVTLWPPDGGAAVAVAGAVRRGLARREREASQGKYLAADCRWHLPADQVPAPPAPGTRIADSAGETWTVLEVQPAALGSRWVCHARNLAIAGGLTQRITLQRAAWTKDAHGAAVAAWSDHLVGLRARLQPEGATIGEAADRPATRGRCRIYLAEPVAVDEGFRVLHGDDVYTIVAYERPERIDELPVLLVESER
jgi:head-tail adaptor